MQGRQRLELLGIGVAIPKVVMILLHLVGESALHRLLHHHFGAVVALDVVAFLHFLPTNIFMQAALLDVLAHLRHTLHLALVVSAEERRPCIFPQYARHLGGESRSRLQ